MSTAEINIIEAKGARPRGMITVREYPAGTLERVQQLFKEGKKDLAHALLDTGRVAVITRNLIMRSANHGKGVIVDRLIGTNTYSLNLTYGEIGTGSTAPTEADTALQTPVARASLSAGIAQNINNDEAQIQYFFPDNTLTNSAYTEFGTFIDGTASLGTGQLFNRALFASPYTKSAGTDITVQVNITLT